MTALSRTNVRPAETFVSQDRLLGVHGPDPQKTLKTFVTSSCNYDAYRYISSLASRRRAELAFVSGAGGNGKTHLLSGFANSFSCEILNAGACNLDPETKTVLLKCINAGSPLIVDDVQGLCGEHNAQHNMVQLIDAALSIGRPVVIASDRSLDELSLFGMGKRLVTLLKRPSNTHINCPDKDLIAEYSRRHIQDMHRSIGHVPSQVAEPIAERSFSSVAHLKNLLKCLGAIPITV